MGGDFSLIHRQSQIFSLGQANLYFLITYNVFNKL